MSDRVFVPTEFVPRRQLSMVHECRSCGAIVGDTEAHARWHAEVLGLDVSEVAEVVPMRTQMLQTAAGVSAFQPRVESSSPVVEEGPVTVEAEAEAPPTPVKKTAKKRARKRA